MEYRMIKNEIKIGGRVYRYNVFHTPKGKMIASFGLQFYNGKNVDGNSRYCFVDCKSFGKEYPLTEKQDVVVLGHLGGEEWVDKQGNKKTRLCIIVDNINYERKEKNENFIEDEIPL